MVGIVGIVGIEVRYIPEGVEAIQVEQLRQVEWEERLPQEGLSERGRVGIGCINNGKLMLQTAMMSKVETRERILLIISIEVKRIEIVTLF